MASTRTSSIVSSQVWHQSRVLRLGLIDHGRWLEAGSETPIRLIELRFAQTNQELGEAVTRVEKLVTLNSSLHVKVPHSGGRARCLMIPPTRTTRFFDRVDVFEDLDRVLGLDTRGTPFRSIAIHGMAGVGKSSIASTYMETRYKENNYDVCLWVRGEKPASLRQSFTDVALRLKLPGAHQQNPDDNLNLVQDWFQYTGKINAGVVNRISREKRVD